jgi:UPF0755 protein
MPRPSSTVSDWVDDPWDRADADDDEQYMPYRPPRRSRRWITTLFGLIAIGLALAIATGALWVVRQINPPGDPGEAVTVVVADGMTPNELADVLQAEGVIGNAAVFRWWAGRRDVSLFPGEFTVREGDSYDDIVKALAVRPEQVEVKVTFPEGFTLEQMAIRLEEKIPRLSGERFLELARANAVPSDLNPTAATLEGLVFPDTYTVSGADDEQRVLFRMVDLMTRIAYKEEIVERGGKLGYTPYQILTIASIIEREAKVDDDRAKIARVIYNRIGAGMNLDIDATVLYAAPGVQNQVTQELIDATADSPYNTYKNPGLPPGPISAPSRKSIEAALNPEEGTWVFYVLTDEEGRHKFANTYEEHLANIADAKARGIF